QGRSGAVDELLKHLVHRAAMLEQQIAAELQLKDRILVGETAALLLFGCQRKGQAGGVNPSLAGLVQASDRLGTVQACSQPIDCPKVAALDKAIAALGHLKMLAS